MVGVLAPMRFLGVVSGKLKRKDSFMPADPTFYEQMLAKYQAALLAAAPGVQSVSVDGTSVSYSDAKKEFEFWEKKVAIESGTRPRITSIDMRNTF